MRIQFGPFPCVLLYLQVKIPGKFLRNSISKYTRNYFTSYMKYLSAYCLSETGPRSRCLCYASVVSLGEDPAAAEDQLGVMHH